MSDREQDPLLDRLKALPARKNEHDPAPAAREAFENAFVPWHQRVLARNTNVEAQSDGSLLVRSIVPVLLAGVIAIYLLWAFASVLALQS